MKNAIRKTALPFTLSFALLAGGALAQSTTPASSTSSSSAASSATKTHAEKRADMVEQQITDAQSSQWNAYTGVMRNNASRASEAFQQRAQEMPTMNADEVMKSYAQLAQMHAEDMQKLSSAWSDLYAVLSPEQKQTADALFQRKALKPRHGMEHKKAAKPASASSSTTASGT